MTVPNTNDGSSNPPALKTFLNAGTLRDLPKGSEMAGKSLDQQYEAIQSAGFLGLQDGERATCERQNLARCGSGRINHPSDVAPLVEKHLSEGMLATTLHVGWGSESDAQLDKLVAAVVQASDRYRYPLYVETHRATITQDSWRTVQIVKRFPEIRFNGDFSHWYTGHEMVYGDWEEKLRFIQPVLERVRFIHGRISTPGAIQAALQSNPNGEYIEHFKEIWRRCFEGFLSTALSGDYLIFAPELLPPCIYYAPTYLNTKGEPTESSDRWQDALLLKRIAQEEFSSVQEQLRS